MRYFAIAAALVALAGACGGNATQPSSSTIEEDLLNITLQDDDVPPEIGTLSEAHVIPASGKECLLPGESPAAGESTLVLRTFDSPEPFPARGAQRVIVTTVLHSDAERAHSELECASGEISQGDLARLLQPDWHLISYAEMDSLNVGEDRRAIHYVAVNAEGLVFVETYWANFRRDNLTALLSVRAPLDNITEEQFESLAAKLDQRVQEGLRSLR